MRRRPARTGVGGRAHLARTGREGGPRLRSRGHAAFISARWPTCPAHMSAPPGSGAGSARWTSQGRAGTAAQWRTRGHPDGPSHRPARRCFGWARPPIPGPRGACWAGRAGPEPGEPDRPVAEGRTRRVHCSTRGCGKGVEHRWTAGTQGPARAGPSGGTVQATAATGSRGRRATAGSVGDKRPR